MPGLSTGWACVVAGCAERMSVRVKAGVARCQARMSGNLNALVDVELVETNGGIEEQWRGPRER